MSGTLHIGCGKRYISGAINVDQHDLTVADVAADARRLPFQEGAFTAVAAYQLIEHLGYAGAIYALAEWRRVLEPGGELILETPDPKGAFRRFLEARTPEAKDRALGWIFGDEAPGFSHTFLYPPDLLELMLRRAGFEGIELGEPTTYVTEPGFRLRCLATSDPIDAALAAIRPRMADVALALADPSEVAELENGFVECLRASVGCGAASSSRHMAAALVTWPRAASWWLDELADRGLAVPSGHESWSSTAQELARFDLGGRLTAVMEPMASRGDILGRHLCDELTSRALDLVRRCRETGWSGRRCWEELFGEPPPEPEGELFTASRVQHLAERLHARALKRWLTGDRAGAREDLLAVCRTGTGQLYAFWNLGRLTAVEGDPDQGAWFLEGALPFVNDVEAGYILCDLAACLDALGDGELAQAVLDDDRVGGLGDIVVEGARLDFAPLAMGEIPHG